jgi:PIN domain nuclease of toxin-antitoxin system
VKLLVDAHSLIWYVADDPRLSGVAIRAIADAGNQGMVSVVTLWELAIKIRIGKLELGIPFHELVRDRLARDGFAILPISGEHLIAVAALPMHHRDPFDRLLVAQAIVEGIPIVSVDATLDLYGVQRIS